jgi:hypothetical protein
MTKREIANLCCRVLAVYVLVQGVSEAPSVLAMIASVSFVNPMTMFVWLCIAYAMHPAMLIIGGIVLWRKSGVVAALMTGHDLQDEPDEPDVIRRRPTAAEAHAIAFSTLGLWLLLNSVPNLITTGVFMAAFSQSDPPSELEGYARGWGIDTLGPVAEMIIGIYLLFGASGLVRLLRKARDFGLEERERPDFSKRQDSGEEP